MTAQATCRWWLASLALLLAAAAAAGAPAADEGAVMRALRQAAAEVGLSAGLRWAGWAPGDRTHHCLWHNVVCDDAQHVTRITWDMAIEIAAGVPAGDAKAKPTAAPVQLPAELAALQWLQSLDLAYTGPAAELPTEWVLPGAFPQLTRLVLSFQTMELPEVQPGALPRLQELQISVDSPSHPLALPPSWGAPGTLPTLRHLTVQGTLAAPLPAAWAGGFLRLQTLSLLEAGGAAAARAGNSSQTAAAGGATPSPAAAGQAAHQLPPEWGRGFPALTALVVDRQRLTGSFPAAWQAPGAFPLLTTLDLSDNELTGALPADIFQCLPKLVQLVLSNNRFSGPLPDAWAGCKRTLVLYLGSNQLSGPAFPPSWVAPAGPTDVAYLSLHSNPGLGGSLPPALPWPRLRELDLGGTGVQGRIPPEWCGAPFARTLSLLEVSNTSVPAELPACTADAMPQLSLSRPSAGPLQDPMPSQGLPGAPGGLAAQPAVPGGSNSSSSAAPALLAAAAVGVAAAAGSVAVTRWRRRQQQASQLELAHLDGAASWDGVRGLLRRRRPGGMPAEDEAAELLQQSSSSWEAGQQQRGPTAAPAAGHARLKSLVQQQLGGRQGQGLALLPLEALPQAVTHQLAAQSSEGGGTADAPGKGDTEAEGLRAWRLPSESLRVDAAELQFISEADGTLVQLGEGAHSVVYLAKLRGVYVAAKVLELLPGMESTAFWSEVALLERCCHPRVVPVLGVAMQGQLLMVAVQLMLGGSLRAALLDPGRHEEMRWGARGRQVGLDAAEALAYLHSQRIMHSDIKSANVLLGAGGRASLADLGLAQVLHGSARTAAGGSGVYAAPEQLLGRRCTLAADVYSLGLLLVELTTGQVIARRGAWHLPHAPDDCPQAVVDLIEACLASAPSDRPLAAEVFRRLQKQG